MTEINNHSLSVSCIQQWKFDYCTSNEMEAVPKSKGNEKARKEFWDSLCEVYENEAKKDDINLDITVDEFEDWTLHNPDTSKRALQLAITNPQVLSAALSPLQKNADLLSGLKPEDNQKVKKVNKKDKNKLTGPTNECRCKSKLKKQRLTSMEENVSVTRRRIEEKKLKSKSLMKLKKPLTNYGDPGQFLQKRDKKQKLLHPKESTACKNEPKVSKMSNMEEELKLNRGKEICPLCGRNLEYIYCSNKPNVSTRPDGIVFNCKLIFKVCYCTYSDVEL